MQIARDRYGAWLISPALDEKLHAELLALTDPAEITDRFYRDLAFGTGGIRGIMGAGTNRMNRHTVRKAIYGLAQYLREETRSAERGVAVAFDTRHYSREFAREAADVLSGSGVPVYLFETPMPTPLLSFAVHRLSAAAGVMVTASHNPKEFNGIKVYNSDGVQLVPEQADALSAVIERCPDPLAVPVLPPKAGVTPLGAELLDEFVAAVCAQSRYQGDKSSLSIVYTPIHGAALLPVTKALAADGFTHVALVPEQVTPDGSFPTVASPNPEERGALALGLRLAEETRADLVLGTDPDGDRLGVGVRHGGAYRLLTGNQIGALLVRFVCETAREPITSADTLVKTVVTGGLGAAVAASYGASVEDTLTGFKYIGRRAVELEKFGDRRFLLGYEESYGYLVGTHARDKDATVAALLIAELAAKEKSAGRTPIDALDALHAAHGFFLDALDAVTLPGQNGEAAIAAAMARLRRADASVLGAGCRALDYEKGLDGLPAENLVKFAFPDGSWAAVRPSGTEPKIKLYYSVRGAAEEEAQARLTSLRALLTDILQLPGGQT